MTSPAAEATAAAAAAAVKEGTAGEANAEETSTAVMVSAALVAVSAMEWKFMVGLAVVLATVAFGVGPASAVVMTAVYLASVQKAMVAEREAMVTSFHQNGEKRRRSCC